MFLSDLLKQSLHASIPFGSVVLARVRASQTKVSIGIANRKIFRELSVRTKMAGANWVLEGFSRPSAVRITPIAPDATARAQNEYRHNYKAWPRFIPEPYHGLRFMDVPGFPGVFSTKSLLGVLYSLSISTALLLTFF